MYVGDDNGTVSVVQFDEKQAQLTRLPYCIPAHVTLGGIVKAGSTTAPSVVGVLPQPNALYSRVVIAYRNGLIILWGLHETQVLAVRGGTKRQQDTLAEYAASLHESSSFTEKSAEAQASSLSEQLHFPPPKSPTTTTTTWPEIEDDEKEICSVCWACGNIFVAGYVDGDIQFWSFPNENKIQGQQQPESPRPSSASGVVVPLRKIDLAPGKTARMPVMVLRWWDSAKSSSKHGGGQLYVYGGGEVGAPEVLKVLSLEGDVSNDSKLQSFDLLLHGPFADMTLVPSVGGGAAPMLAAVLLVLSSPGLLHLYDEAGIASCFSASSAGSHPCLQPVAWQPPITEATISKLILLAKDSVMATGLFQLNVNHSVIPPPLSSGTKWPITGGHPASITIMLSSSPPKQTQAKGCVLITGQRNGDVRFWDASSPTLHHICTVTNESKMEDAPTTALDFCVDLGYLAVGNKQGEVRVYRFQAEPSEVNCHVISSLDNLKGTEVLLKATAQFQCVVALGVHRSSIQCVAIASSFQLSAAGDTNGLISVLDLSTCSLLFLGDAFESKKPVTISSLAFAPSACLSNDGTTTTPVLSPPVSPFGNKKQQQCSPAAASCLSPVIYAVNKEAAIVVIDGSTGHRALGSGPLNRKHPSTAVSMYLLDASGAPLNSPANKELKEQNGSFPFPSESSSNAEAQFLLLCCEESLHLFSTSAVIQGLDKALQKVELQKPCIGAFPFQDPHTHASGLLVLFRSGQFELRSLPNLDTLLLETTLSKAVNWQMEPNLSSLKTFTCASNGRIALIDGDRVVVQISLLAKENDMRLSESRPQLLNKNLATAQATAMTAPPCTPKKKLQIHGLIEGVIREIKNIREQPAAAANAMHLSTELPKLFSSRPFTTVSAHHAVQLDEPDPHSDLDIDDLDIADLDESLPMPEVLSKKDKLVRKIKRSFQGKVKTSEAESRLDLFEGSADNNNTTPRVRSADTIKAAYGHQAGDASITAGLARDKLIERQEKLEAINQQTQEMQVGAENFASTAAELAKKMETRKWYEF
ncbi:hypothetical protein CY35_14G074200 [Sphagnum magellanicum]|nr:hypothetical protein CY35_14G074200 [Sphagnum magellanicum]